jgi:predicted signal transduction protein with EAL and GGDEF domain
MVLDVGASVGVAWVAGGAAHDGGADALIARADAAMYESKRAGDGRAVLAHVPAASAGVTPIHGRATPPPPVDAVRRPRAS